MVAVDLYAAQEEEGPVGCAATIGHTVLAAVVAAGGARGGLNSIARMKRVIV